MTNGFTPTQKVILTVLSDGKPHLRQELVDCLDDPLADRLTLKPVLYRLRKKLRPQGQEIVAVLQNMRVHYRHVRLLHSYDE